MPDTDRRVLAWRKLAKLARAGGGSQVRNWYTKPGEADNAADLPANVTSVRLTPMLGPEEYFAQGGVMKTTNRLMVEARVGSSKWEDLAALWSALAAALAWDPSLQADGIDDLGPLTPADTAANDGTAKGFATWTTFLAR